MGFIEALKALFTRVIANIVTAVNHVSTQHVTVAENGDIIVKEPAVKWLSDKLSAIVLVSAAMFFLMSPIQGRTVMVLGDQLLRAAAYLWEGIPVPAPST